MDIKNWLDHLESVGPIEVTLPHDYADELLRLAVPHEDINGVIASAPRPGTDTWGLLQRSVNSLVSTMGDLDGPTVAFPTTLPDELGPYFYTHVFAATAPFTRAYHRERGIPADVSWATLADMGRHMAVHRRRYGTAGVHAPWWHSHAYRGTLYDLGRLQFERVRPPERTVAAIHAAGVSHEPGDLALSVHIPDFRGPFTPEACDAAFARAREFFPTYFPEQRHDIAVCDSWLLDEQLAAYLPADSNIVHFQRRFAQDHKRDDDDGGVISFVYGRELPVDEMPRRTTLERAVADHLRAGGTWHGTHGWFSLK